MQAGPALLVRVGLFLILATAAIGTSADADLWGHLRFGQDILRTASVIQTDEYSFTSDRPWINHEWLSEVSFALAYRLAGVTGLVLLKLGTIAALLAVVWWHLRQVAPAAPAALWLSVLTFIGTYWRTHSIRPQLFSVLLFAIFLVLMFRADTGRRRGLLLLPPLMVLWVNLHGGWIVGLGVLGFWVGVRCLDRRQPMMDRAFLAFLGLGTVLATLLNPHGVELWRFIAETVRFERSDIQDWGSVLSYPLLLGVPWALVGATGALAMWRGGWPRRTDYVMIVVLTGLASLRVSRLDAFFALAVVILLAPEVVKVWPSTATAPAAPVRWTSRQGLGVIGITAVALSAMLVPALRIIGPHVGCVTVGGAWAPDAEGGRFIALNQLKGRMLTWFDWGEYAIWHFGPDLQVSMDGRRETVYSDRTIQAHRRFYAADESALPFLDALNPHYIWVPRSLPIGEKLADVGWIPIFIGRVSVVFARSSSGGSFEPVGESAMTPRCFPGP